MLEMILIITGLGTALVGSIIVVFEWRALVGYWRGSRNQRLIRRPARALRSGRTRPAAAPR